MTQITIKDVNANIGVAQSYDIVNAIRNSAGDSFQQYVPLANYDNVAEVGAGIMINQTTQNDFITSLVNRIGLVVVRKVLLQNPLKKFKKGAMPNGLTIEEIFTDIAQGYKYDPDQAVTDVFKRVIPNVKVLFHQRNRQDQYKQTISDEQLSSAFTSWNAFDNFVASIYNALYNAAEVDDFEYMKLLVDNAYAEGVMTVVSITDPVDSTSMTAFAKQLRATARKMTLPQGSRDWNALAVRTRTDMADLHLFIDADLEAEMDVDVLAKAFNMDRTNFLGNVTVIDGFASNGLKAVLVDKSFFMVYDNLLKMETMRNSQGLYWNVFLNVWQTLSTSRFANAVAFVVSSDVAPVTNVIVDPAIVSVKAGNTFEFTAYVRATDGGTHNVSWSVAASTSATTLNGSTIDSNGVLTVGASQTGELLVKASTSYLDSNHQTTLSASAAAAATSITVVDATKFSVGDYIKVGTEPSAIQISAIASETITLASGLTAAQSSGATVEKQVTVTGQSIVTVS